MAYLAVTGPRDLMVALPDHEALRLYIAGSGAKENEDGSWTASVYALENQIPALEALGYDVRLVTTDAQVRDSWRELLVDEPEPDDGPDTPPEPGPEPSPEPGPDPSPPAGSDTD
jgi:hypothetical protein